MSETIRKAIVKEFVDNYGTKAKRSKAMKGFETIQIRIGAHNIIHPLANELVLGVAAFDYNKAYKAIEATDVWEDFKKWLIPSNLQGRSKNWVYVSVDYKAAEIRITCQSTVGAKGTTAGGYNLDRYVPRYYKNQIQKYMKAPMTTQKFEMAWEHGARREADFVTADADDEQGVLFGQSKRDERKANMRDRTSKNAAAVKGHLTRSKTKGQGLAPGAKGTVVEAAMRRAILAVGSPTNKLNGSVRQVLIGALSEYFGYDHKVIKNYTDKQIIGEFVIQGSINPVDRGENTGAFDSALAERFKLWDTKGGRKEFMEIAEKYIKGVGPKKAADLWNDSTNPLEALDLITKKKIIQSIIPTARPNMRLKVNKRIIKEASKVLGRSAGNKATSRGKKVKMNQVAVGATALKRARSKRRTQTKGAGKTGSSPIALRNLLNEALPEMVASKMTAPALQFRTGRFANSAQVEMVTPGPRGGTYIDYSYLKMPYQTFEPGFKQGSTMRDPRRIIGESIRELALGLIGRQPTAIRRM